MPQPRPITASGAAHKVRISCREAGGNHLAAVVLLHGVGSGAMSWSAQLDSFSRRYHVLAWDAPGYGESEALAKKRAAALLSSNPRAADIEKIYAVMSKLRPDGYAQAVRMLGVADIFDDIPRIACPMLVICGDEDRVTPPEGCERIAKALPGARFALLSGVGHACYVEDLAQFDAAVMNFLDA